MNRGAQFALAFAVGLVLVGATFAGGLVVGRTLADVPSGGAVSVLVEEVADLVREHAIEPSSEESMAAGAAQGLLDSLDDPYAVYFDEDHYRYVEEMTEGEFFGIGVTVTQRDGKAIIVAPIEGTPGAAAGLLAEDEIVSVDGYAPETWSLDDVVARIRGEEGTEVILGIHRENGDDGPRDFDVTITRARIEVPNTASEMLDGGIGYVRLLSFNSHAAGDLEDILREFDAEGAQGIILDLRDNPGGLLDASIDVASLFIEDGVVVSVEERDRQPQEYRARGAVVTDLPLVVLINENSASASEIVAGAVQDYDRGTLVGAQTYGKGSVQTIEELRDGGAVKFTTARYLTPSGRSIAEVGLDPDVPVEMSPKDQADRDIDIQFQRAVEVLTDLIADP